MKDQDKTQDRRGMTKITSVSVSNRFQDFIEEYDISPTEAFRKGIAVTLFDLGVPTYQSDKNKERLNYVQKFLKELDKDEELEKEYNQIKLFLAIKDNLDNIKQIIADLENDKI